MQPRRRRRGREDRMQNIFRGEGPQGKAPERLAVLCRMLSPKYYYVVAHRKRHRDFLVSVILEPTFSPRGVSKSCLPSSQALKYGAMLRVHIRMDDASKDWAGLSNNTDKSRIRAKSWFSATYSKSVFPLHPAVCVVEKQ